MRKILNARSTFAVSWAPLLVVSLLLMACSGQKVTPEHTYSYQRNIVYKQIDGIKLYGDMHIPDRLPNETIVKRPAVVVVHGGSWARRFGDMNGIARELAKKGFIAFNITYRLAPQHRFPAAAEDVTDAVRFLQNNADKFGIDKNRISGWGYSAGAHLTMMAGLKHENQMRSIVVGGGPTYLPRSPHRIESIRFIGQHYKEAKEKWEAASPVNYVTARSPPVFIYHGVNDDIVEPIESQMLEDALKKHSVKYEYYKVPFWGHVGTYAFSRDSIEKGIRFLQQN